MLNNNGFRRRGAISAVKLKNQTQQNQQIGTKQTQNIFIRHDQIKFTKLNQNNHTILKNRKKQQQLKKAIDDVIKRKCTFYRLGFKSYQKSGNKKLFGQVFGLGSGQMKGTIHVGELWSNHETKKFFKQNKIHITKTKLMDKLQDLRPVLDEKYLNKSQSVIQSTRSFRTTHHFIGTTRTIDFDTEKSIKKTSPNESIQYLKKQLKYLNKTTSQQYLGQTIKQLQKCKENLQKVQRKYFLKMIQIQ